MKALLVVVFAAFVASASAAATIQEEHPIDWYDCSQKVDGNYDHPTDCTRFISCSGGIASQRDCAICHVNPRNCPDGRLVYNSTVDQCLWADETTCGGSGGGSPSSTVAPTPSIAAPTSSDAPTQATSVPTQATSTSTEANPISPPTELPEPGSPCNPDECRNIGRCQDYRRCDKDSGRWVNETCGPDLVWNPDNGGQIHGGNCDDWDNLSDELKEQLQKDRECFGCYWKSLGVCEQNYIYQPPNGTRKNPLTLSCSAGLVFVLDKETCLQCEDVVDTDNGGNCCR